MEGLINRWFLAKTLLGLDGIRKEGRKESTAWVLRFFACAFRVDILWVLVSKEREKMVKLGLCANGPKWAVV